MLPCTRAFRSPLIFGSWPAPRYTQSPCPWFPISDIMHGSRLAQLVIATTRHAARHRSHRRDSASHHSTWNRRPQPSPRYVIYASTVHGSQLLSLYVCMHAGTRHPRTGIEGATAGGTCQARRQDHPQSTPLTGKSPPNCLPNCLPNCQPNCLPN